MGKSSISRKPQSEEVENFIKRGLTSPDSREPEKISHVSLRLPLSKLQEIDSIRAKRRVKISRHTWFLEAIEEKLQRESDVENTSQ